MITKQDIKLMPFTFIAAPILLVSLIFVIMMTYSDMIEEKEFIVGLSCPQLKEYTEDQVIKSKLYFGSDLYLSYAEERFSQYC